MAPRSLTQMFGGMGKRMGNSLSNMDPMMLSIASQLMANSAPSTRRRSLMEGMGPAILQGQQMQRQAAERKRLEDERAAQTRASDQLRLALSGQPARAETQQDPQRTFASIEQQDMMRPGGGAPEPYNRRGAILSSLATIDPSAAAKYALEPTADPNWQQTYDPAKGEMVWTDLNQAAPGQVAEGPAGSDENVETWLAPFDMTLGNTTQSVQRSNLGNIRPTPGGWQSATVPQYEGDLLFDDQVGRFYQLNPSNNKKEFVTTPQSASITSHPDGTFTYEMSSGNGLSPSTTATIEKKIVGLDARLGRLDAISAEYKPKYQNSWYRLGQSWTGVKAKFLRNGWEDIPEEDQAEYIRYKGFRRDAIENINDYIKEITGAQMSEKEANRLRLAQPDSGEGIFDGDDPIAFQGKMDSAISAAKMSRARYAIALERGLDVDPETLQYEIPLDNVIEIMAAREQELEGQGMSAEAIELTMRNQYGVSI